MQSAAKTVAEYLAELPEDRRKEIRAVRKVIKDNLPTGLREVMLYGMITYVVPLSRYPKGYLEKKDAPLPFIALASQKGYMALYLMSLYGEKKVAAWFKKEYAASGKRLDMGKSCVRFRKVENLPLDVIAKAVSAVSMEEFIDSYEKSRTR